MKLVLHCQNECLFDPLAHRPFVGTTRQLSFNRLTYEIGIMNSIKDFFVLTRSDLNKVTGECKICGKLYTDNAGSTGNFHKHLKRKHATQYTKTKLSDPIESNSDSNDDKECTQPNVIRINETILKELIIKCNLPPSLVEHVGFRRFMKVVAPKWKPTSSRYLTRTLLSSLLNSSQEKIKQILNSTDHLSITVDVWTDRRGRSFIGVTGHFLDTNFVPLTLLLDFSRLKGSHTGENIRQITREILEKLNINGKVFRVVTDNAASMIKAYEFGLIVSDDGYTTRDNIEQPQQSDRSIEFLDDNDFNTSNGWYMIDWQENDNSSIEHDQNTKIRLSCFAHTLQLAIRDGLKDAPYLPRTLTKCIELARRSNKSTKIVDLLDAVGKTINRSNATRWSSEYLLIKSIVELGKTNIDEITDIIDDDQLQFSGNDFIVLKEAIDILEPFAEITTRIQSESTVTISLVVPSVVHLIEHLRNIKPCVSLLKTICQQLECAILKRFAGIAKRLSLQNVDALDHFSDPIYFICAVLDPQFKFYWLCQLNYKPTVESQVKQSLIEMIIKECECDMSSSSAVLSINNDINTQSICPSTIKKRKLFRYDNDSNLPSNSKMTPIQEIHAYMNDPIQFSFSSYWKNSQLTCLKDLVRRLFSVQASSAPIERVFSHAGLIMSPRRTTMRDEIFRSLLFLRVNQNLV